MFAAIAYRCSTSSAISRLDEMSQPLVLDPRALEICKRRSNHPAEGWRCLFLTDIGLGMSCLPILHEAKLFR